MIFIALFFGVGLVISLTAGFIVGNRISYIVFVSLLSSLCFALLGFGIHKVLEMKVPEFLTYLAELAGIVQDSRSSQEDMGEGAGAGSFGMGSDIDNEMGENANSMDAVNDSFNANQAKKSGKFGDHLVVENVPIKNEPKLMAEAIRTMMAKDDEN